MNFNIFNSIILAGIVQGLIFGGIVWSSKKYKSKSVFLLAALIVVYSLSNFQFYLQDIGYISYEELFRTLYFPWTDLAPILLYFYVLFYLDSFKEISKIEYLLLIPFILTFILNLSYKLLVRMEQKNDFLEGIMNFSRNYTAYYTEFIAALLYIIVIISLFKKIKTNEAKKDNFKDKIIKSEHSWLKKTLCILLFLIIIWMVLVIADMNGNNGISYYPIWIGVAFLIYWLGHIGIYKYGIIEERKQIRKKRQQKNVSVHDGKTKHIIIERLKQFLEHEKRFLEPDLSLEKTAEDLELSRGHLSKIINTELGLSFKDYLNALRVEEAKSYLIDNDFSNYTLVAIGLEAGFNSKSTFNSSFKKITGETPSQYKQRHLN